MAIRSATEYEVGGKLAILFIVISLFYSIFLYQKAYALFTDIYRIEDSVEMLYK